MVDNIRVNLTSVRAAADAADELAAQLSMPTASSVVSGGTGSGAGGERCSVGAQRDAHESGRAAHQQGGNAPDR